MATASGTQPFPTVATDNLHPGWLLRSPASFGAVAGFPCRVSWAISNGQKSMAIKWSAISPLLASTENNKHGLCHWRLHIDSFPQAAIAWRSFGVSSVQILCSGGTTRHRRQQRGKLFPSFFKVRKVGRCMVSKGDQSYNVQQPVPLWLWILQAFFRSLRDAVQFLWEQPGQLEHIEWPSFQSTVKMALLTLVVVALLIVFLATVDSAFSYLLAKSLRQVP